MTLELLVTFCRERQRHRITCCKQSSWWHKHWTLSVL